MNILKGCCRRAKRFDFHVLHFSIQSNHLHLIAEASDNEALARGMQSLASAFAKRVKEQMLSCKDFARKPKGSLFNGRYHLKPVRSPTQMKNTLKYVLLNYSKHSGMIEHMDVYSTAKHFPHWRKLLGRNHGPVMAYEMKNSPHDPEEAGLSPPQSWLAREGWMKAA